MHQAHFTSKIYGQTLRSDIYSTIRGISQDHITEQFKASYSTLTQLFNFILLLSLRLSFLDVVLPICNIKRHRLNS